MADPRLQPRRQTPDFNPSVGGVRPAASGSFNYAPPPREQGFADAIKSLSAIEPEIEKIVGNMEKRGAEEDANKGRQKALELALSDAEAIKQGKLSPGESKWFMRGYKEQYWRTQGISWGNEAREAWMQSPEKNSDDPAAAQKFLAKFFDEKLKGINDPIARSASLPVIDKTFAEIIGAQSDYRSKRVYEDHLNNVGVEISGVLDDLAKGRISDAEAKARVEALDAKSVKLMGVKPDDFNATLARAIASKARQFGNTRLLEFGKSFQYIGNNPKYMDTFRSADDAILSRAASQESLAWTREQRARAVAARQWTTAGYEYIVKNGALPAEEDMARIRRVDPEVELKLRAFHRQAIEDQQKDDPLKVAYATIDILRSGDRAIEVAQRLLDSGAIKGSGAAHILSIARMVQDDGLTKSAVYKDATSNILRYSSKDNVGIPIDPVITQEAVLRYSEEMVKWRKANPAANEQELVRASQDAERRWSDWAIKLGASGSRANPRQVPAEGAQSAPATPPADRGQQPKPASPSPTQQKPPSDAELLDRLIKGLKPPQQR
jgi:hypothetical protein